MSSILRPGYVRWDGLKYVLDPDIEIVGPPGTPGPAGPTGPAGSGGGGDLVYRPGGVTTGNVFATWTEVMAKRATIDGPVNIIIDDVDVSPAPIDVGSWDLTNTRLFGFNGLQAEFNNGPFPITQVLIPDGAQLLFPKAFYNLDITGISTSLPSITGGGDEGDLSFEAWNTIFRNDGVSAIPLIDMVGGTIDLYGSCHMVSSNNSSYILSNSDGYIILNVNDQSIVDGYCIQFTGPHVATVNTTGNGFFGAVQPATSATTVFNQSNIVQSAPFFLNANPDIIAERPVAFFSPITSTGGGNINLASNTNGSGLAGITGTSAFSAIMGGVNHQIHDGTGNDFIGGGFFNTIGQDVYHGAAQTTSVIVGGQDNGVSSIASFIGGGVFNSITGGEGNSFAVGSFIGGGQQNSILLGAGCFIGGGLINTIGDGSSNTNINAVIVGGGSNTINGGTDNCTIGGGGANTINAGANNGTIAGGNNNIVGGGNATVGGGSSNTATGSFSTVPGGASNSALGDFSFACGVAANASREMQWAYSGSGVFVSVGDAPQYSMFFVKGEVVGATTVQLSADLFTPTHLNLVNGVAYMIRATCVANRVGVAGRAMFIHTMLAHASGGTAVIDSINTTLSVPNGQTWSIGYSASALNVIATFTGSAGADVRATVLYEFVELPGGV